MIKRNGVRGTMESVLSIEVNIDTVYVRSNIQRIEEPDFSGWEYDEIQYNKDNYIEEIAAENERLRLKTELQDATVEEIMFTLLPELSGGGGL